MTDEASLTDEVVVKDHLEPDSLDACGYCGQYFGPETVTVEKEVYGRKWRFCDESCFNEFMEHTNFKDENLDGDDKGGVTVELKE